MTLANLVQGRFENYLTALYSPQLLLLLPDVVRFQLIIVIIFEYPAGYIMKKRFLKKLKELKRDVNKNNKKQLHLNVCFHYLDYLIITWLLIICQMNVS